MKLWHGHSPRVALAIVITQRQRVAAGIQDGAVAGDGSKSTRALRSSASYLRALGPCSLFSVASSSLRST